MKVECEVWSRCSGYFRPVSQWNKGKQEEQKERRALKYEQFEQTTDARIMEESI